MPQLKMHENAPTALCRDNRRVLAYKRSRLKEWTYSAIK